MAGEPTSEAAGKPGIDLDHVDRVVARFGRDPGQALPILQALQAHYRYLPDEVMRRVCELTEIHPSSLTGVSTFYAQFRHRPMGRHHVKVCNGTACHIHGAEDIHDAMREHLHIPPDEDTDADGNFTVEKVFCVGCCTLAPVVQIRDDSHAYLTREAAPRLLDDFLKRERRESRRRKPVIVPRITPPEKSEGEIRICLDSCCIARGCGKTHQALADAVARGGLNVTIKPVGCVVMCDRTPLVEIARPGLEPVQFSGIHPEHAESLLANHFNPGGLIPWLRRGGNAVLDWLSGENARTRTPAGRTADAPSERVAAFFGRQRHIATEHYGKLDPLSLEEYLYHDGFSGFLKATGMAPPDVIDEINRSGLRGRGGAGFPTARKWRIVREAESDTKYVICNGDEGDPGAFMDRMLMESFPFRVIEGMMVAAFATGANMGYVYVRAEYPSAVRRLRAAIGSCRDAGWLGTDIRGTGFSFELDVFEGAGAFVCGEETAMLESMEGRRGIPRLKPPFPAEQGYKDKPTLINNVETFANIPWILRHGGAAYAAIGSSTSKGTKVFALAGKIKRGGLIEVPMGITIREIVEEIGGGTPDGKPFKAVLVGGPSGGCVPNELADTPVDYESLSEVGAIMGSGGLIVLDGSDCMVEMARYFLDFCQCESCGKCTFCRIGTRRMLDILDRLRQGKAKACDLTELTTLSDMVRRASLCGLGKTAPNPVLSALRFFRDEFEAHLHGRCPAGKCKGLITYSVMDHCVGCTLCAQRCPVNAIPHTPYRIHRIDTALCTRCNACREVCPENAILVR